MSKQNFKLADFLPYRLSIAANTVSKRIADTYAPYKLSRTQWRVMAVLASAQNLPQINTSKKCMSAQMVADKTGMDKTTVSRAVKKLLDMNVIVRDASPEDARAASLSLNADGLSIFSKIIPQALDEEQKLKTMFTDNELRLLISFLDRIVEGN